VAPPWDKYDIYLIRIMKKDALQNTRSTGLKMNERQVENLKKACFGPLNQCTAWSLVKKENFVWYLF
jgi:hypothetical protein